MTNPLHELETVAADHGIHCDLSYTGGSLNERALALVCQARGRCFSDWGVKEHNVAGAKVYDFSDSESRAAALWYNRLTMAWVGCSSLTDRGTEGWRLSQETSDPVRTCLHSQLAGWMLSLGDRFVGPMSGPIRLGRVEGREKLLDKLGASEPDQRCYVGMLETHVVPSEEVISHIAGQLGVKPDQIVLLMAKMNSLTGMVNVVGRTMEVALHKMGKCVGADDRFSFDWLHSARGVCPLPSTPVHPDQAMNDANDAITYLGFVELQVKGVGGVPLSDELAAELCEALPSCTYSRYGEPFMALAREFEHEFYSVAGDLFAPAKVRVANLDTGEEHVSGRFNKEAFQNSCGTDFS